MQGWPDPQRYLTIAVEALELHPGFLAACTAQSLFVLYSFLPRLCPPQAQCTQCLPPGNGTLAFHSAKVHACGPVAA